MPISNCPCKNHSNDIMAIFYDIESWHAKDFDANFLTKTVEAQKCFEKLQLATLCNKLDYKHSF